jgi:hypothetical protein
MKFFTVHENPAAHEVDERVILVKEGLVWPAFALPLAWLIYKRAWLGLGLYAVGGLVLLALLAAANPGGATMGGAASALILGMPALLILTPSLLLSPIGLLFALLCAFEAGDVLRFVLARRGYRVTAVVSGKTLAEAEHAYFSARPGQTRGSDGGTGAATPVNHPAARRAGDWASASEPILGLFPGPDTRG